MQSWMSSMRWGCWKVTEFTLPYFILYGSGFFSRGANRMGSVHNVWDSSITFIAKHLVDFVFSKPLCSLGCSTWCWMHRALSDDVTPIQCFYALIRLKCTLQMCLNSERIFEACHYACCDRPIFLLRLVNCFLLCSKSFLIVAAGPFCPDQPGDWIVLTKLSLSRLCGDMGYLLH